MEKLDERVLQQPEAVTLAGLEAWSWGLNSRGKAERARELLEWRPTRVIGEWIGEIVEEEKERLDSGGGGKGLDIKAQLEHHGLKVEGY